MAGPPSSTSHRVVIALLDGRRERGVLYDFSPNGKTLHLFPAGNADAKFAAFVDIAAVKAVFFVRTHEGDRARREAMRKAPPDTRKSRLRGRRVKITFSDGEELLASTENYSPARPGFFAYPLDPGSNNLRIFVVNANVRQVTTGAAEQDRLVKAAPRKPPADPCRVPLDARVEAVLRVVAGEDPGEVAEAAGVPAGVLSLWARMFLEAGKAGLGASDGREDMIKELSGRVATLEDEVRRLRGMKGRSP